MIFSNFIASLTFSILQSSIFDHHNFLLISYFVEIFLLTFFYTKTLFIFNFPIFTRCDQLTMKDYKSFAFARSIYVECVCQTFIGSIRSAFSRPRKRKFSEEKLESERVFHDNFIHALVNDILV